MRKKQSGFRKFFLLLGILFTPWLGFGMTLRFTGNFIPSSFVQERLVVELHKVLGEEIRIPSVSIPSLRLHEKKFLRIPVQFPDGTSREELITLISENVPMPSDTFLLFSDHPEILDKNGPLFTAGIIFLRPIRLNYYHKNGKGEPPRALTIRIKNSNPVPAVIHVISAEAAPAASEMSAGHEASLLFLQRMRSKLGYLLTIPPEENLVLSSQILNADEISTGFLHVLELKGEPLEIGVFAEDPKNSAPFRSPWLPSSDPHARGAYEMSKLTFQIRYRLSDPPVIVPFGDLPLPNLLPEKPLKGGYGMFWTGKILLENPYPTPETVAFSFEPRGGSATATVYIQGILHEIPFTPAYKRILITKIQLPPKASETVSLETMPEGGSSYPVLFRIERESGQ